MHRIVIFISIYSLFYNITTGQIKSKDTLKIIVANGSDIVYDEYCQNSIFYDKETGAICKNGHYSILCEDKAKIYGIKHKRLVYGDIVNGKKEGWWRYEYLPDSNNNTILKYEVYKNGLLLNYYFDLFYKETDSLLKILYQADFKNGTGYYKDYNHNRTLIAEGNYKDGCKDGWWKYYNSKGLLIRKEKYNKGILKKLIPIN